MIRTRNHLSQCGIPSSTLTNDCDNSCSLLQLYKCIIKTLSNTSLCFYKMILVMSREIFSGLNKIFHNKILSSFPLKYHRDLKCNIIGRLLFPSQHCPNCTTERPLHINFQLQRNSVLQDISDRYMTKRVDKKITVQIFTLPVNKIKEASTYFTSTSHQKE